MENNLKDLLIDELHDILSSEEQIVEALPEMVIASESPDLKKAFESHLKETKGQIQRLKKIFKFLKVEKKEKFCKATKGLIQECKEVLKDFKTKSPLRDAALISKAQRIEHYEISAYGTVRTFAKELDLDAVAGLLQETLDEEGNADKKLTKIAEGGLLKSGINQRANRPSTSNPKDLNKQISSPKKPKIVTQKPKIVTQKPKIVTQKRKSSLVNK
jgi:ferritin-like metal-binding protein YciE